MRKSREISSLHTSSAPTIYLLCAHHVLVVLPHIVPKDTQYSVYAIAPIYKLQEFKEFASSYTVHRQKGKN